MAFPRAKSKTSLSALSSSGADTTVQSTSTSRITSRNPWDQDNPYIKSSRDALILAEQMNIKTLENEMDCAKTLADLPSSKLITLQREITDKKKNAAKLQQDVSTLRLHSQFDDILNLDTIEKRINMLKQMCNDLDTVLRNKERLITRLQKPFVCDFIKIEAEYHKYFRDVLTDLVSTMTNVSPYLDNMTWVARQELDARLTEPLVMEVQSLMASLQTSYQMLHRMKTGIGEMQRKDGEGEEVVGGS